MKTLQKVWNKLVVLILAFLLIGCVAEPPSHFKTFWTNDPELMEALEVSVDRWAYATNWGIYITDNNPEVILEFGELRPGTQGNLHIHGSGKTPHVITVENHVKGNTERLVEIVMHEVGHSIAQPNSRDVKHTMEGLMDSKTSQGCINQFDLTLICQGQCEDGMIECYLD